MAEVMRKRRRLIKFALVVLALTILIILTIAWFSPAVSHDVIVPLVNTPTS